MAAIHERLRQWAPEETRPGVEDDAREMAETALAKSIAITRLHQQLAAAVFSDRSRYQSTQGQVETLELIVGESNTRLATLENKLERALATIAARDEEVEAIKAGLVALQLEVALKVAKPRPGTSRGNTPPPVPEEDDEDDDDDDSDAYSMSSVRSRRSATSPRPTPISKLAMPTSTEIAAYAKPGLAREPCERLALAITEDFRARHPVLRDIIDKHARDKNYVASDSEEYEGDAYIKRVLRVIVDTATGADAKVLQKREDNLIKTDISSSRSGLRMLTRIKDYGSLTEPSDIRKLTAKVSEEKPTLVVGASYPEIIKVALELQAEHQQLPDKERAAIDLHTALLRKLPAHVMQNSHQTYAAHLEEELDVYEREHGVPKHTFEELAARIARRLSKMAASPAVHVTTRTGTFSPASCT